MASLILSVSRVVQATPRSRLISLHFSTREFEFVAGQAVMAGLADSPVRRPYSLACSPTQAKATTQLDLLVLIDDHAAPDPHLERARVGTELSIEGPFGTFAVPEDAGAAPLLLVAGGTGIAPLRAMLWESLSRQPTRPVSLIYSARGPDEFAFLGELRSLAAQNSIELHLAVTRGSQATWAGARGRIEAVTIGALLTNLDTRCAVCGPPAFVSDLTALLVTAGIPSTHIVSESAK